MGERQRAPRQGLEGNLMAYAKDTTIPVERSLSEIVAMLRKSGASRVAQMQGDDLFEIQFAMLDRAIRFRVRLPTWQEMPEYDGRRSLLAQDKRIAMADQVARQRARALMLVVKAKLESVESEVETFEQAFLANVVMSDGMTLYERVSEPIALEYKSGRSDVLLLGGPAP